MRPSPPGAGCDRRLVAQLPWTRDGAAVVGKGGAGEARRPEGRGWIVREAVALLGLAEQAGLHLGLIALGVENGDGIGPRRDTVEHAGRVSVLDRRDRAAHFAARLAETVGGSIEPAAHGPAVVAETADGYAQFPRRLRARPGCKREHEDEGEKRRPHRISPVVARHLALSKAMPKPSSGRLISIGFLLASCTVILRSLPARMAAMNLSVSVMATKHPTLVQVWIDCRSAVPLSTFTKTGSVRLRPSGSVITIAPACRRPRAAPAPTPPIAGSRGGRPAGRRGSPASCRRPRTRPATRQAFPRVLAAPAPIARWPSRWSAPSRRPPSRRVYPPLRQGGSQTYGAGSSIVDRRREFGGPF